jgi:DNA-binding Lrp family transcriptional regulator
VSPTYVTRAPLNLDALDLAILREMYRDRAVNLAGIDPRLNATQVAHRLRVGRARVAARLRAWKESGFLRRYDVWLNPALLGWPGAWVGVRVEHPRQKADVMRRLGLVDGAVGGMEFLGDWVSVAIVGPDEASIARRVDLLRGLAGVREVEPPVFWQALPPRRPLTSLDIRIVRALRERPTATLSETARRVGVSPRTMTRKYADLVNDRAVWFVPIFDFTATPHPVVSLSLLVDDGVSKDSVARTLRRRFPLVLDFSTAGLGPDLPAESQIFFVVLASAASLEDLAHFAETIEGVKGVETYVFVRMFAFPDWFDRHLETMPPPPSRPPPSRRAAP